MGPFDVFVLVVVWFLFLRAPALRTWPMAVLLLVLTSVYVSAGQFGDVVSSVVRIGVAAAAVLIGLLAPHRAGRASNRGAPLK